MVSVLNFIYFIVDALLGLLVLAIIVILILQGVIRYLLPIIFCPLVNLMG
jgi:TRAP-type C4-dicarboxylate transport system permease small subunit